LNGNDLKRLEANLFVFNLELEQICGNLESAEVQHLGSNKELWTFFSDLKTLLAKTVKRKHFFKNFYST
jgi:hypothetical protein